MKITLKYYKFLKIKLQLKKNEILLFYYLDDSYSKTWFIIEKSLKKLNLKHYKLQNQIAKKVFNESIYIKFKHLVTGPIIFVTFKILIDLSFSAFYKINKALTLIGIKLNITFYLRNQISTIRTIKYKEIIAVLCNILKEKIKFVTKILFFRNNVI
jgi:hypothetical protein